MHKRSSAIVKRQAAGHAIHLDLGVSEEYYGIPVNVAAADQPRLPLHFGVEGEDYGDESDKGPVPIPAGARIEGWRTGDPDPGEGDRHVITVQSGRCELVELYKAQREYDAAGNVVGWRASAAARWDLSSNKLRPAGWTSADAAGLPILPGLLSYDEAASGRITHALRFTLPSARAAYVSPARHCGPSGNTSATLPSYGMRFRLKKSVRTATYTGPARAIVVAMKRYGLMYADQGSSMYVTGTADPRWEDALDQFRSHPLDGAKFEVVRDRQTHPLLTPHSADSAGVGSGAGEGVADRDQLGLALGQLGLGVGAGDDAAARRTGARSRRAARRSAGPGPTRRHRWRRSSRPDRRSARAACPRSR